MQTKPKILIVDDEEDILKLYSQKFSLAKFNVIAEKFGKKVLDLAKSCHPDVILLDILMPDVDGYKIIKLLKSDPKTNKFPIILFSNLGDKEDIEKGILLGAEDYIPKANFTPDEVVKRVRTFLTKRND